MTLASSLHVDIARSVATISGFRFSLHNFSGMVVVAIVEVDSSDEVVTFDDLEDVDVFDLGANAPINPNTTNAINHLRL